MVESFVYVVSDLTGDGSILPPGRLLKIYLLFLGNAQGYKDR